MDRDILAAEHAAAQAQRRRWKRAALIIGLVIAALVVGFAFVLDATGGIIAFFVVLGVVGLVALIVWIAERATRADGPSPRGPLSYTQVYTQMPAPVAWEAVLSRMAVAGIAHHQVAPTTVKGHKSMDWLSYGSDHLVDVRPSVERPGLTVVTILATPSVPSTMTDYGRTAKVNNHILSAVA